MFEFGTEVFFAFWIASTSVGLPDRSAPPSFAATSMFLMSLANDLARRESLIAFWCLVVAHLEWPDMTAILPSERMSPAVASPRGSPLVPDPVRAQRVPPIAGRRRRRAHPLGRAGCHGRLRS